MNIGHICAGCEGDFKRNRKALRIQVDHIGDAKEGDIVSVSAFFHKGCVPTDADMVGKLYAAQRRVQPSRPPRP